MQEIAQLPKCRSDLIWADLIIFHPSFLIPPGPKSLNLSSLPQIMGTLLEPDLLSSLVCTLASSLRASSASHPDSGFGSGSGETPSTGRDYLIVLKEEDRPLLRVIGEMMSALPRCTRFGTAMAFLDGSERAGQWVPFLTFRHLAVLLNL